MGGREYFSPPQAKKKADAAEPLKDSTTSAYSLTRPPESPDCALVSRPKVHTNQNKKADVAEPFEDSIASAYSLSRPPASAELRVM